MAEKIKELRKQEQDKIPQYYEKWKSIGFDYRPINKEKSKRVITEYMNYFDVKMNHFLYFDSPMACQLAINILDMKDLKDFIKKFNKDFDKIKVDDNIPELNKKLSAKLLEYIPQVRGLDIKNDVNKFSQYLRNHFRKNVPQFHDIVWYGFSGNLQAGYNAYFEFYIQEIMPNYELAQKIDEKTLELWRLWKNVNEEMHVFWVFDDIAFCSELPTELHFENERLHNFNGPACQYDDGYSLYYMRGVKFDENIVKMKPEDMDFSMISREDNAERRFILAEKIGIDRILDKTESKIIEEINGEDLYKNNPVGDYYQHGDVLIKPKTIKNTTHKIRNLSDINYKLVDLKIGEDYLRYLIMTNPSVNDHRHIEGIPNDINTVAKAIFWRNQVDYLPCKLT